MTVKYLLFFVKHLKKVNCLQLTIDIYFSIGISREARDYSHLKPVSKHIAFVKAESNPPTTKAGAKGDVQSPHK